MNAGKFSLTELKRLVADGQRRDLMDAKEYIQKYFFPLSGIRSRMIFVLETLPLSSLLIKYLPT